MRKSESRQLVQKETYTAGEIAALFSVSHRTACKYLDKGVLPGFRFPGSQRRLVRHADLVKFVAAHPEFAPVLTKLEPLEN